MGRIGQWNIYTSADMIRGVTRIQNSRIKTDVPSTEEMKPFKCPNCGGNSYRKVNGKIVCDYCDTEFLTSTIPSENPLNDLRPKPIPTRTTR